MSRGVFVTLEGVEGVGKSTACVFVQSLLDQAGISYVLTREPGGTPLAEDIRQLLLQDHAETVAENTELLLMFAARSQNVEQVILPALTDGKWVIADRFTDASFAYQGGGRGVPLSSISALANLVQGELQPDVTLLLDAPVEVGLARMNHRGSKDRIESEKLEFFQRVRQQYLEQAQRDSHRFRLIDAEKSISAVEQQIKSVLDPIVSEYVLS